MGKRIVLGRERCSAMPSSMAAMACQTPCSIEAGSSGPGCPEGPPAFAVFRAQNASGIAQGDADRVMHPEVSGPGPGPGMK